MSNAKSSSGQTTEIPIFPQQNLPIPLSPVLAPMSNNPKALYQLENNYLTPNISCASDFPSCSTDQIIPSPRTSFLSEATTEVHSTQFKFEKNVQKVLKLVTCSQKFCTFCNANTYFTERYELQKLSVSQYLHYWLQSLKCCNEPKKIGKPNSWFFTLFV